MMVPLNHPFDTIFYYKNNLFWCIIFTHWHANIVKYVEKYIVDIAINFKYYLHFGHHRYGKWFVYRYFLWFTGLPIP